MLTIADLLARSRAAHAKYRTLAGKVGKDGKVQDYGNPLAAAQCIHEALLARTDAEALDPEHRDAAWAADQRLNKGVSSSEMETFLARFLTPVEARRA